MVAEGGETAPRRLASDATLTLLDVPVLAAPLRAAADSFGAREAVAVRQETVDSAGDAGVSAEGKIADVIAAAADVFTRALVPARTSWYVVFARDRIVLAYRDSSPGAAAIDSTNWWKVLQRRGVRIGRAEPASGPAGYRALLVMQLAETHYHQPKLGDKLLASSRRSVRPNEAALVAALDSAALDYIWVHESRARAAGLRYMRLPHEIDLGELADSALYAAVDVTLPAAPSADTVPSARRDTARVADTLRVRGAPIVYGVSILNDAPRPRYAERFLRFLLSDDGRRVLEGAHLDVLPKPVAVGTNVPAAILRSLGDAAPSVPAADTTAAPPPRR
jgi:molybdate/tungstate transport system substrate-binding protein